MPTELALFAVAVICAAGAWFIYEIITAPQCNEVDEHESEATYENRSYRDM